MTLADTARMANTVQYTSREEWDSDNGTYNGADASNRALDWGCNGKTTESFDGFIEFASEQDATAVVVKNAHADFKFSAVKRSPDSEVQSQPAECLTVQVTDAVRDRGACFDTLSHWYWAGHGDTFGGLLAMLSHGESQGLASSPTQLAMARLGRWAASIFDANMSVGSWLGDGVAVVVQECELMIGECEAHVRGVIKSKAADLVSKVKKSWTSESTVEKGEEVIALLDEFEGVMTSMVTGLRKGEAMIAKPIPLLEKARRFTPAVLSVALARLCRLDATMARQASSNLARKPLRKDAWP